MRNAYRVLCAFTYSAAELEPGAKILRPERIPLQSRNSPGRLALIEMVGLLTPGYLIDVRRQLIAAERNESIGSVLLYVDSPGGFVLGTPETAAIVRRVAAKKRVTVMAENYCASGAYWISSQASDLILSPSCYCGSIGSYNVIVDDSEMHERMGVKIVRVRTGSLKGIGTPGVKPNDEEIESIQRDVDSTLREFQIDILKSHRVNAGQLVKLSTGEAWRGKEAVQLGLGNRVGLFEDVIEELHERTLHQESSTDKQRAERVERLTGSAATEKYIELVSEFIGYPGSEYAVETADASIHRKFAREYPKLSASARAHRPDLFDLCRG